jgi:hypothetical protein
VSSVSATIHSDYLIKVGSGWLSITKTGNLDIAATADANVVAQVRHIYYAFINADIMRNV